MAYELFYWSSIQGRGEFVRLSLEEAQADYRDVNRETGDSALFKLLDSTPTPSFAPPVLRDGDRVIGQTAAVLFYLGPRIGLAPGDEDARLWTHQVQMTIADFVNEIHDVHHPLGSGLYYEDQKPEARRRADNFRAERLPKFLGWFEMLLERNPDGPNHLVGNALTYADLSLFQVSDGLAYAFPQRMGTLLPDYPKVGALHERVAERPHVAAYLASERRLPFSEDGIFRHYPELDGID